ncbi:helix-turn-helix domain-containing protein [Neisseria yangbaofengii]|uniref:helix-turn-helix domain-containing protein n=1 Tax=Neisseria yangbaofengii TaxID=2709396 RepID=UPI0013EA4077|nr:helix-turn-helix transcriptional regulator [Neisseria yangbaofengii]
MKNSSFSGNRLKEERKKLGLTQAQAAEKCGVSGRMWGDYERGISQPKTELFFRFEKAGIDVQYVMHGRHDSSAQMPSEKAELNRDEQAWLDVFRQLAPAARQSVLDFACYQLAQQEKKAEVETGQIAYGT